MENQQEKLSAIVNSIIEAAQCDDQEMLLETFKNIPEEFWNEPDCFVSIMETFFDWIFSDFEVSPTGLIPGSFWENNKCVWIYAQIIYGLYDDGRRVDYDLCGELLPRKFLKDRNFAELFLRVNYFETIDDIPKELLSDPHTAMVALTGLNYAIEQRENFGSFGEYIDREECLKTLLDYMPKSFASDKEFVLNCFRYQCQDEGTIALFDWMDAKLWSDKEVVKEFLEAGWDVFDRISEDLMADEEFQDYLSEN